MHHCHFWLSLVAATWSLVHSEEFTINPWELPSVNAPFQDITAAVGDTITFVWEETSNHTVSINPTGSCDATDAVLVGEASPVTYTFTDADVSRSPILFADNTNQQCDNGMNFTVTVQSGAPVAPAAPTAAAAPTGSDTAAPEAAPTDAPTDAATTAVPETTAAPTVAAPVAAPTLPPVDPTEAPVAPTETPILIVPTEPPVAPTDEPSIAPVDTTEPTVLVEPTVKPTVAPTQPGSIKETLTGLRMGLAGVTTFPQDTQANWEQSTKEFSESFILNDLSESVTNFQTTYEVVSVTPVTNSRTLVRGQSSQSSRQLQQEAVIIAYTQRMQYDTTDRSITALDLATLPFESNESKQAYVSLLKTTGDPILQSVIGVSNVIGPPAGSPSPSGPPSSRDDDPVLSTPAIIGIACGGGALLILIVLYFLYCRGGSKGGGKDVAKDDEPPLHVNVRDDEVSTLAAPTGPPTYGDQRYVERIIVAFIFV